MTDNLNVIHRHIIWLYVQSAICTYHQSSSSSSSSYSTTVELSRSLTHSLTHSVILLLFRPSFFLRVTRRSAKQRNCNMEVPICTLCTIDYDCVLASLVHMCTLIVFRASTRLLRSNLVYFNSNLKICSQHNLVVSH